jgi:hypothetical protein
MIAFLELGKLGRFGNSMFQIASTIGLATKHGYSFAFPKWENHDHKSRFGSSEDCDLQKYFLHPLPLIPEGYTCPEYRIPWGWHPDLRVPDNVTLWGHMQSEKYFIHCQDLIRYYFRMKDEYPISDYVGLHWRSADYDNAYHPIMTLDYYQRAMRHFADGTKYLVFTDNSVGAAEMFANTPNVSIHESINYIDDFKRMRSCSSFIISNSTYSWWASWLSEVPNKKIIAPSNWFGPSWGSGYREMSKDIYPKGCIVI